MATDAGAGLSDDLRHALAFRSRVPGRRVLPDAERHGSADAAPSLGDDARRSRRRLAVQPQARRPYPAGLPPADVPGLGRFLHAVLQRCLRADPRRQARRCARRRCPRDLAGNLADHRADVGKSARGRTGRLGRPGADDRPLRLLRDVPLRLFVQPGLRRRRQARRRARDVRRNDRHGAGRAAARVPARTGRHPAPRDGVRPARAGRVAPVRRAFRRRHRHAGRSARCAGHGDDPRDVAERHVRGAGRTRRAAGGAGVRDAAAPARG